MKKRVLDILERTMRINSTSSIAFFKNDWPYYHRDGSLPALYNNYISGKFLLYYYKNGRYLNFKPMK